MSEYQVNCPYCKHKFAIKTAKTRGNISTKCFGCGKTFYVYPIYAGKVGIIYKKQGKWVRI